MIDGRFDQHFAEVFAAGQTEDDRPDIPVWKFVLALAPCIALIGALWLMVPAT